MNTVLRIRLTQEAKARLLRFTSPINPVVKPFLDRIAGMLVASLREGLENKTPQDGQSR